MCHVPAFASKISTTSYTALLPSTDCQYKRVRELENSTRHEGVCHKSPCPTHSHTQQRTGTTRKQSQPLRRQRRCAETTACDAQLSGVPRASIRHRRGSRSRGISIPLLQLLAISLVALERSVRMRCSCSARRTQEHGSQREQRK